MKSKIVNKHETNPRRKSIEDFKNTLTGKDDLDAAVEMRYDFTHEFVKNYDIFLKIHFDDPRVDFTNSESKCNSLNFELKSISDKLLMIGDDTTSALIREQTDLLDQISSKRDLITEIKVILAKKASLRGELKIQWDKASKKNIKAKKLSHEIKIWDMIYEHINKISRRIESKIISLEIAVSLFLILSYISRKLAYAYPSQILTTSFGFVITSRSFVYAIATVFMKFLISPLNADAGIDPPLPGGYFGSLPFAKAYDMQKNKNLCTITSIKWGPCRSF